MRRVIQVDKILIQNSPAVKKVENSFESLFAINNCVRKLAFV